MSKLRGFWTGLTKRQQEDVLAYRGPEDHGDPALFKPIDYATKCKRRRTDGPTPCLCCQGECVG